jgi:hypothetical protein
MNFKKVFSHFTIKSLLSQLKKLFSVALSKFTSSVMSRLIFLLFVLNFASSTPIPKSKAKIACESFGERLKSENDENLMVKENYAKIGEFPFAVGLHYDDGNFKCSGVLISEQFVVTSANCVRERRNFNVDFVRLGRVSS